MALHTICTTRILFFTFISMVRLFNLQILFLAKYRNSVHGLQFCKFFIASVTNRGLAENGRIC